MLVSGEKKNGHGGARRGAGRKPIDTKQPSTTITLRVPLWLRKELREYTNRHRIPIRVFLEQALAIMKIPKGKKDIFIANSENKNSR